MIKSLTFILVLGVLLGLASCRWTSEHTYSGSTSAEIAEAIKAKL